MSSREELSSRQSDYSTGSEDENDDIDWKRRSRRPDTHRNTDTSRSAASGRSVGKPCRQTVFCLQALYLKIIKTL